jgi:hypothetical protein
MEIYSKSPGFIKCWPRCLNMRVAKASQSHRMHEAISDDCLQHLSHPALSASGSLSKCPYKRRCPISSLVIILNWLVFKLSNSKALLVEDLLRKPLACLSPQRDCQYSSCFLLVQPLITPHGNLCRYAKGRLRSYKWMWGALLCEMISYFTSITAHVSCTHTSWILICSVSFTRNWWQSHTNLKSIWKLSRAYFIYYRWTEIQVPMSHLSQKLTFCQGTIDRQIRQL